MQGTSSSKFGSYTCISFKLKSHFGFKITPSNPFHSVSFFENNDLLLIPNLKNNTLQHVTLANLTSGLYKELS